ncbi:hypothetical protein SmJEL517_g04770 [Synchytrium microbalum]|uniref:UspA domain-containing protein n=1 Tax=Synchytrium microbalum TaxID=1806994 RepID=A0A507BY49_9FUNG|nr:uncharacterized protein SmJEL517_g04770 [Synchytrium microbalum]TPX32041.1 hypothetical protein SmJEL517_g04770 [Synchytrium microbalum]
MASINVSTSALPVPSPKQRANKTVLMGLDESRHSSAALQWVFDYLLVSGDKLVVVTVIDKESERESTTSRVKTLLRAAYEAEGIAVSMGTRVVVSNNAGQAIASQAEEVKPAFLVLSSAGKSHVEGLLVGSVSQYCIKNVQDCPVIIARMTKKDELTDSAGNVGSERKSPSWF